MPAFQRKKPFDIGPPGEPATIDGDLVPEAAGKCSDILGKRQKSERGQRGLREDSDKRHGYLRKVQNIFTTMQSFLG